MKKVVVVYTTEKPIVIEMNPYEEQIKDLIAWTENDFICKNLILNGLPDDYYNTISTSKDVCDALQKKYDTEQARSKMYAVS